jgi:hypothetical protein
MKVGPRPSTDSSKKAARLLVAAFFFSSVYPPAGKEVRENHAHHIQRVEELLSFIVAGNQSEQCRRAPFTLIIS